MDILDKTLISFSLLSGLIFLICSITLIFFSFLGLYWHYRNRIIEKYCISNSDVHLISRILLQIKEEGSQNISKLNRENIDELIILFEQLKGKRLNLES
jgi:hypothetical protein